MRKKTPGSGGIGTHHYKRAGEEVQDFLENMAEGEEIYTLFSKRKRAPKFGAR